MSLRFSLSAGIAAIFLLWAAAWLVAAQPSQQSATAQQRPDASGAFERDDASAKHAQSKEIKTFRQTAISVTFPSHGLNLHGWIYKPPGPGPFPAVIWNHGNELAPSAHPELGKFYTDHGYVLFLPIRRGHGESPGMYLGDVMDKYKAIATSKALLEKKEVDLQESHNGDVAAAVAWLQQRGYIDARRIAVSGVSYGGIQTLLAAENGLDCKAFIAFAPGAMSWDNPQLQKREAEAARRAHAPLFLIQARNDYSLGPSEVLGPIVKEKGGLNRAKVYPAFGTTLQEGDAGFACWEEGIAIWGGDVLEFLSAAGMTEPPKHTAEK